MLRLSVTREARWITLACGVELLVDPLTSVGWALARNAAGVADLPEGAPRDARFVAIVSAVAPLVVRDWRGVGDDDGNPIPVTPDAVAALMDLAAVNDDFAAQVVTPYLLLVSEKNGSAPSSIGSSAGAPTIAGPAEPGAPNVPSA